MGIPSGSGESADSPEFPELSEGAFDALEQPLAATRARRRAARVARDSDLERLVDEELARS